MPDNDFKFTKVYEKLGIIKGQYDGIRIRESWRYSFQFYFRLLAIFSEAWKNLICSIFFDKDDPIQFYLGDW